MCHVTIEMPLELGLIRCAGCGRRIPYYSDEFDCDSLCRKCIAKMTDNNANNANNILLEDSGDQNE